MNRSALCIKMLNLLSARGLMSRDELANELETNKRNISEFKKELEIAGYVIDSISGKNGGYLLRRENLFPALTLNDAEIEAINETSEYLKVNNFTNFNNYMSAVDKIKTSINRDIDLSSFNYLYHAGSISESEKQMIEIIKQAISKCLMINLNYLSNSDTLKVNSRQIQPYELLNTKDGNYCLAYDLTKNKNHAFKIFKIVDTRMNNIILTNQKFNRDLDFKLSDHVGKQGLFKHLISAKLIIKPPMALIINESNVGVNADKKMRNNNLELNITMESEYELISFILSLSKSCIVVSPLDIKKKIINELSKTLSNY